MYHVSAQGVDGRMPNVYYYCCCCCCCCSCYYCYCCCYYYYYYWSAKPDNSDSVTVRSPLGTCSKWLPSITGGVHAENEMTARWRWIKGQQKLPFLSVIGCRGQRMRRAVCTCLSVAAQYLRHVTARCLPSPCRVRRVSSVVRLALNQVVSGEALAGTEIPRGMGSAGWAVAVGWGRGGGEGVRGRWW